MNEYRKLQYEVETLREHIAELNQLNHTTGLTEHEQGLLMDYHSTLNLKEHIKAALKTKKCASSSCGGTRKVLKTAKQVMSFSVT